MDPDGESDKQFKTKREKITFFQRYCTSVMFILQPLWVRCSPVLFNNTYGKYLESQLRFVLYCGSFFWMLYLLI